MRMKCSKCEKIICNDLNFCPKCGNKLSTTVDFKSSFKISKNGKYIILSFIIITVLLFFIGFFLIIKNSIVSEIKPNEFINYVEKLGCEEINDLDRKIFDNIEFYYSTDINSCPFEIKYFITKNNVDRDNFFYKYEEKVFANKDIKLNSYLSLINYYSFSTKGNHYRIVIENKDSVLYLNTKFEYYNEALKVLDDLGYGEKKFDNDMDNFFFIVKVYLCLCVIMIFISWWNLNKKFGRKGWICLIPLYNLFCLSKDIFNSKIIVFVFFLQFFLLFLIGFNTELFFLNFLISCLGLLFILSDIGFCMYIIYKLGKVFNQSDSFITLMIFITPVFLPILAFNDCNYNKIK